MREWSYTYIHFLKQLFENQISTMTDLLLFLPPISESIKHNLLLLSVFFIVLTMDFFHTAIYTYRYYCQ